MRVAVARGVEVAGGSAASVDVDVGTIGSLVVAVGWGVFVFASVCVSRVAVAVSGNLSVGTAG